MLDAAGRTHFLVAPAAHQGHCSERGLPALPRVLRLYVACGPEEPLGVEAIHWSSQSPRSQSAGGEEGLKWTPPSALAVTDAATIETPERVHAED
jgi:hypothetical protein